MTMMMIIMINIPPLSWKVPFFLILSFLFFLGAADSDSDDDQYGTVVLKGARDDDQYGTTLIKSRAPKTLKFLDPAYAKTTIDVAAEEKEQPCEKVHLFPSKVNWLSIHKSKNIEIIA